MYIYIHIQYLKKLKEHLNLSEKNVKCYIFVQNWPTEIKKKEIEGGGLYFKISLEFSHYIEK